MKNLLTILSLFLTLNLFSQIPDTIYIEPYSEGSLVLGLVGSDGTSDSVENLYIIYEGRKLYNLDKTINTPIDRKFTEKTLTDYLVNTIYRNENLNWIDNARLMERSNIDDLYTTVNGIFQSLNIGSYYDQMLQRHSSSFAGTWEVTLNGVLNYITLSEDGTAFYSDASGVAIEGKSQGSFWIKSENRFMISGLEGIDSKIFNKELNGSLFYDNTMESILKKID